MDRNVDFSVKGNTYKLKMPTMGQLIEIENRKAVFAQNNYGGIVKNKTNLSERSLDMVDMAAYLYTLAPDLIKDLNASSLFELDVMDAKELYDAFKEQVLPWIANIESTLLRPKAEKKEDGAEG